MKKFYSLGGMLVLAAVLVMNPITVRQAPEGTAQTITSSFSVDQNAAEARSRSRSRSRSYRRSPSRRSSPKKSFKRRSSSKPAITKKWKPGSGGGVFKKGDSKGKARVKKARPKTKPTVKTTRKPTKSVAPKRTTRRPVMNKAKRTTRLNTQRKSISSPKARTSRMSAQRTRGRTMYQSRSRMRTMRSSRAYWGGNRYMYNRNVYWGSRRYGGWGYGYYPGLTFHRGWGVYGYGYTRGGISIVDVMILHALFNHRSTPSGQTVVNNYYVDGKKTDVVSVPAGTTIIEIAGGQKALIIPDGEGGTEQSDIPAGSTISQIETGTLIQTPDGQGVLIPKGADAYKAAADYKVPETAQKPQEYAAFPKEQESKWYCAWMCKGDK